jgi:DNA invertase Pin-like site-specific DNA recombinase
VAKSLGESWCDTTTDAGQLMPTIMGGIAEFERGLIRSARTRVSREPKQGKKFGRPDLIPGQKRVIADRYGHGATIPELAEEYQIGVGTIWRALQPETRQAV